jgi:hypothetical protein
VGPFPAEAVEYSLQVANLIDDAFAHFMKGLIGRGEGELALTDLERALDSAGMSRGAILYDREIYPAGQGVARSFGAVAAASKSYSMEPAPLAVDLDGDGIDEVVVQNQMPGMLAVVFRGPAGYRFQQVNSGFEGLITGLGAIRGPEGEPPTLVAAVVRLSGLLKTSGETQITMTGPD